MSNELTIISQLTTFDTFSAFPTKCSDAESSCLRSKQSSFFFICCSTFQKLILLRARWCEFVIVNTCPNRGGTLFAVSSSFPVGAVCPVELHTFMNNFQITPHSRGRGRTTVNRQRISEVRFWGTRKIITHLNSCKHG